MVASKKLSKQEQRKNTHVHNVEKKLKEDLQFIRLAVKRHEISRAQVVDLLIANDWTPTSECANRSVVSVDAAARAARKKADQDAKKAAKDNKDPDVIDEKMKCLGNFSWQVLSDRLLPCLHKRVLSARNITAMLPVKAKATDKKECFQKLLEYLTGEGPTCVLDGSLRTWSGLYSHLQACCEERGRLSPEMELPPQYNEGDGIYYIVRIIAESDEIQIGHRFSKATATLAATRDFSHVPADLAAITIKQNHRESGAHLHFLDAKNKDRTLRLAGYFTSQRGRKRALALTNSPASSSKRSRVGSSPGSSTRRSQ